ncbi:dynamin family protein [Saprospiraceae bacterium]|nr:dynamin family protein [Saprospiraceae bacterium]
MREKIDRKIVKKNVYFKETLNLLLDLTNKVNHEGFSKIVAEIQDRIETPFTFVIVGEVKAGKSSFVNALLDANKEICKVAPSPMTDTIQQILYKEEEHIDIINPYLKKIYQPVEILKEISIVDTPGTNTIVDHHQEITERFIPFSDLIVFVFEAKNPYRQSAWEFFDYIHEDWRRKVIFILQQKDLMNQEDLDINIQGVLKHAKEKGINEPKVFAVSAKQEMENQKSESGFIELRSYIEDNITGGKAPELKLQNNIATAKNINEKIRDSIAKRNEQYELDYVFRLDIQKELQDQTERSTGQAKNLAENLAATYQRITTEKVDGLEDGLSFGNVFKRSIRSFVSKEVSLKEWMTKESKDLENQLNLALKDKLNTGIVDVADQIQNMIRMIDMKLKTSKTVLENNDEVFSDIAINRNNVLKELQASFQDFMQKSENFYDENSQDTAGSLAPNLAAGGGIAIVGAILSVMIPGAVFDITGGILTALGMTFAGVSIALQKGKVLRRFKKEIKNGQKKLEADVMAKLNDYISSIKSKMEFVFTDLDDYLEKEKVQIEELLELNEKITDRL